MDYCDDKSILDRIKRLEGQVRSLQNMYGEKRTGGEILQQIVAARASLAALAQAIVQAEVKGCLPSSEKSQDLSRLVETLFKVS